MQFNEVDLRDTLINAIKEVVEQTRAAGEGDLAGFALCTDDDVMSLYQVHLPGSAARDDSTRFEFWEWTDSAGVPGFADVSEALRRGSNDDDSIAAVDRRFKMLVEAMEACRVDAVFAPATFLCVASTDPDEHSQASAMDAAKRLNGEAVADQFFLYAGWSA